ncbi:MULTISPECIES: ATP-dependent Clp protease proteolytic subunit [unclassified Beijerinckia]|uniref:ATP-dependent Clp protease proteolytic subunit n=1 Tax=unclassified Beijerinckia TaxID=2638183 RepID=UPI000B876D28|nr:MULTISPECIES: ATP-dependent Clp protease proteolytic subunit [unclassified Beijerinckia]MDH7796496.1 hypothetical protein [Beijerinckia sp. GAS462]
MAVAMAGSAHGATFELRSRDVIAVEGYIELGDCARWAALVTPAIKAVELNSPGGRAGQGECISRSISGLRLKTIVHDKCASICFLLFAAGAQKSACPNARIGVHRPNDPVTRAESSDPIFLKTILEYADRYRVPGPIKAKLSGTPSRDMYWLTREDLTSMNATGC